MSQAPLHREAWGPPRESLGGERVYEEDEFLCANKKEEKE